MESVEQPTGEGLWWWKPKGAKEFELMRIVIGNQDDFGNVFHLHWLESNGGRMAYNHLLDKFCKDHPGQWIKIERPT